MRKLIALLSFLLPLWVTAQNVGINNPTPAPSALLDLTSTDKGLLVPRMSTAQRDGIPVPALSLLIYNTSNTRFEYFNGTLWVPLVANTGWLTTGNAGTDAATNFVGTTDNIPLVLRTNNTEQLRILGNGNVGINVNAPQHRLDVQGDAFFRSAFMDPGLRISTNEGSLTYVDLIGEQGFNSGGIRLRPRNIVSGRFLYMSPEGRIGIATIFPEENLHVVGNIRMVDGNQAAGRVMVSDAFGTASWQVAAPSGGTLDQAYDFGGPGAGRTIIADAGAVQIIGTDGLQVSGTYGSGAVLDLAGAGTRMFFNPRKAAFRVGRVTGDHWDDADVGWHSSAWGLNCRAAANASTAWGQTTIASNHWATAWGLGTTASGTQSTASGVNTNASASSSMAWGETTIASGIRSTAWGNSTSASNFNATAFGTSTSASGNQSTAWGLGTNASGTNATAIGAQTTASGPESMAWGQFTNASGLRATTWGWGSTASSTSATAWGQFTNASGMQSTAWGGLTSASGLVATAWGVSTTAPSWAETALGAFNTAYVPVSATEFQPIDRLLVVGNGVNGGARSDALVILKNGNTGVGVSIPTQRLHVAGSIRMVDGNEVAGRVMVSAADGTGSWADVSTTASGTLDQAYDFGGAGVGRTITADAGAVQITGVDGFVSTGTFGSGAIPATGAGVRMMWYPRKAAFRVGSTMTQWDDANIGDFSAAWGTQTTASGYASTAGGVLTTASGSNSMALGHSTTAGPGSSATAWGFGSTALSQGSTAWGNNTLADGLYCTAWGDETIASGASSTSWGQYTTASNNLATAWGIGSTASGSFATAWGSGQATGSASTAWGDGTAAGGSSTAWGSFTEANGQFSTAYGRNNVAASYGETVLGIGATAYTPSVNGATQFRAVNATDRLLVVGNAIDANNNNFVDPAERSDALVILKNGNTGVGASIPTQRLHVAGSIRMVDGNQAAGRVMVSAADGTGSWADVSTTASGTLDQAYDFGGAGVGRTIVADAGAVRIIGTDGLQVSGTYGSGAVLDLAGAGTRMFFLPRKAAFRAGRVAGDQWDDANVGLHSTAWGLSNRASGFSSTAWGSETNATVNYTTAWGENTIASATSATAWGVANTASGVRSTVWGNTTTASGINASAFGFSTTAAGNNATAFGIGNSAPSLGETALGVWSTPYTALSATAINVNDRVFVVGNGTSNLLRNDALVILKNGNTGVGVSIPTQRLHVAGSIRMVDGNQAAGRVMTSAADGTASWQVLPVATATAWGLAGNAILATNFIGSTNLQPLIFRTNNVERMRITPTGLVGIGIAAPAFDLTLANNSAAKPGSNVWTIASDARLKRDVSAYTDGLALIRSIDPIWYTYTGEAGMPQERFAGAMAQDIQRVAPYMVRDWTYTDEQGQSKDYLAVDYGALDFAIINAIKEQQAMIEELQAQLARMNAELERLRNER